MEQVITDEILERVSRLAALEIGEMEKETVRRDLGRMVSYVGAMEQVDTSDVPPLYQVLPEGEAENVLREDEVRPFENVAELLESAPERRGEFVAVPATFDRG
ncbi:MAG: Asp-tRNA(Asn)/Glu-tRNA(Gln) amidotransferase subunit GatC [Acetatifactor sp.]|nr:Asp-tRNA(Asn)/Glu-tRNA(Gln) amidotransferase subunit GatC [Acetatifactor sp.]